MMSSAPGVHVHKKLGEGAYATVYLAEVTSGKLASHESKTGHSTERKLVALKRSLPFPEISFYAGLREASVLAFLQNHPHIINFEGVISAKGFTSGRSMSPRRKYKDDNVYIGMEYAPQNLNSFITQYPSDYARIKM